MTYNEYLKQNQYAKSTIKSNEIMVLNFITWLDQQNIEAENVSNRDLLVYIKYCQHKEMQQITIERYFNAIKLFYAFKVSTGTIKSNPVTNIKIQGIKRKKLYHTFTAIELNQIYNNYNPETIPRNQGRNPKIHLLIEQRNKVMLGLFVYQGIQSSELSKLEIEHIKLREGQIEIPGTKRSNTRILQLESQQVLDIYNYILQGRPEILKLSKQETEQLFISPKGGKDQSNYISALMRELKRQNSNIKNAQQLRTSVIVKWLKQYNLRETQYKAGHRFISSTESFLVNETEGLQEEVNQFHPLG
ncbi:MAG: site-specific integrase [Flavobacteriales bacterium]|nr:site-specific integrase [Flavobacteriales bacterium]